MRHRSSLRSEVFDLFGSSVVGLSATKEDVRAELFHS